MTHVHYKFSSKLSYDTVLFDGPHVTLRDLKRLIMGRERLRAGDCDLQITNAQSKEEYTDDEDLIPKGSSVIVRRIPGIGGKSGSSCKTNNIESSAVQFHHAFGVVKAMDGHGSSGAFLAKMANLAEADVSEEDKIKVMLNQSTYDSMSYKKFGTALPANYTCYRCGNTGHHIRNCPTSGQDKNLDAPLRIRKSTGIPRSFMVEVDDPNMKGAMLTNSGRYAIPAIDAEAYAIGKKEKPPFIPQEKLKSEAEEDPVPDELLCLICRDLLSDAVVIPCCGNSYCDDCIRTNLLDSEEHVCPTCSQSDVSPDTLIANKFLRQAVNTFKKERGYTKNVARKCPPSQPQSLTTRPSPVTSPPPVIGQDEPLKPQQVNQDTTQHHPEVTDPLLLSVAPPAASGAASVDGTPIQPEQSCMEIPEKETDEKTQDDSVAVVPAPSVLVSSQELSAASQLIPVVNHIIVVDPPQTVSMNQQQFSSSSSSSLYATSSPCGPPTCWESSSSSSGHASRTWTNSSSSSTYSAATPPLFPSPIFLSAHQSHRSYPPGYQPAMPLWPVPGPQGTPIPSLCSPTPSSSIPSLIPDEWYKHQRQKNERAPPKESSYRHLSSRSNLKSSKSKSSRSYSNSSSRSRSRSRSRSKGRSRHQSPYSRHRDLHTRSRPCSSYSYGYKRSRSPTPSSSSSPRVGYYSRSKSPTDSQKKRHHSHHQNKKSSSGSYGSRRRGDESERATERSETTHTNPSTSLDLDRELYLQWKKEYKEWCERYFSSYVGHFHQLPLPLLNLLPPPPPPQWVDREGGKNNSDPCFQPPGRRATKLDDHSPLSRSSSSSQSPPSQSSSDSHSTPSQSYSDSGSSPSHMSSNTRSPPPQPFIDGRSKPSEHRAHQQKYNKLPVKLSKSGEKVKMPNRKKEDEEMKTKNLEDSSQKHDRRRMEKSKEGREEESFSPAVRGLTHDTRYDQWLHDSDPHVCKDDHSSREKTATSDNLNSRQPSMKTNKSLDKHCEREGREKQNEKGERRLKTSKHSDTRRDVERPHKVKPGKEQDRVDTDPNRSLKGGKSAEPRSEKRRKRKGEELERNETQGKSISPNPKERKKENNEKEFKTQPLTDRDIWEEGIKVKPQKKISININLDGKSRKMDQDLTESFSQSVAEKTNEEVKSNRDPETIAKPPDELSRNEEGEEKNKPAEVKERRIWDKGTFREVEMWKTFAAVERNTGEKKKGKDEDFDLWHCALKGAVEEEERDERRSLTEKREREERIGQWQQKAELVQNTQKEAPDGKSMSNQNREISLDELKTNRREELMEGVIKQQTSHNDRTNTAADNGSSFEDRRERTMGKALEENTQERAPESAAEHKLVKVPLCKWDKECREDKDEAEMTPVCASPSEMNEQKRWRSVDTEMGAQIQGRRPHTGAGEESSLSSIDRARAPSSGKHKSDRTVFTERERERGTEQERNRDREGGREGERQRDRQKESRGSKDRRKEEERGRYRGIERGHDKRESPSSGFSSSSSKPHDKTLDWQQRGDHGCERKYFHPSDSNRKDSSSISTDVDAPDIKASKVHRETSVDQDPSCNYGNALFLQSFSLQPRVSSSELELTQNRSMNRSKEEKEEWKQNTMNKVKMERKSETDNDSKWDWRRELEEGERPSSQSSNSSSSTNLETRTDDGRRERKKPKKHRKDRRRAEPELDTQKRSKKNTGRREEESGGELEDAFS